MTDELPTPISEEIENEPSALASDAAGTEGEGAVPNVVPGDVTAASAAGDLGQVLLASALANTHGPGAVVVDSELQLENDKDSEEIITAATSAANPYGMVDTGQPVSPGPFFEKQENLILDAAVAEANAPGEAGSGAQEQGEIETPGESSNDAATLPTEYQDITMTDLTMTDVTMQDAAMYDLADEGISAEGAADFAADSVETPTDTPSDSPTDTPADSPADDGYNDMRTAEEREARRREKGKARSHSRPRLPSPEASVERLSNTRLARIRSGSVTQRDGDISVAMEASDSSKSGIGGMLEGVVGLPEVVVRDFAFEPVDPRFRGDVPEGWIDAAQGALRLSQISDSNAKSSKYSWGFVTFHDGQDGDFDGDYEDASDVDDDATKATPDSGESFVPGIYAALYDFAPELESEMKLTIGEVLTVFSKECDGWVQAGRVVNGNFTGEVGLVPENYLARIQVGDQAEHASPDMGGSHGGAGAASAGDHGGAEASPVASPVVEPDAVAKVAPDALPDAAI